ncbi:MAG: hypothetical protein KAI26_04810 [Nanoarchaeota archaeon]|nr:hypothetical protein [Nanoarchaeota archaeon]
MKDYDIKTGLQNPPIPTEEKVGYMLSEGRRELDESLQYMDKIKTKLNSLQINTKDIFEKFTQVYESKAREIEEDSTELTQYDKVKAFFSTLPGFAKRDDTPETMFGNMLDALVEEADNEYSKLEKRLKKSGKILEIVEEQLDNLIINSKKYGDEMRTYNQDRKNYENKLQDLEAQLADLDNQNIDYLDIKQDIIETKRGLEKTNRLRSSALNKYNNALNLLDALECFRDENVIMNADGENVYELLVNSSNSIKPLFNMISSSANLADAQVNALKAHDLLKEIFNPAMIAVTAVAKSISKVATERMKEKMIVEPTIDVVTGLSYEHKKEINERYIEEDMLVDRIINNHTSDPKQIEEGIIDLGKDENGDYRPSKDNNKEDE